MKITVLAENTACDERLGAEHGLSLLIETESHKILFDMGQTELFSSNAEIMGKHLADVDIAVVSHGHYDHGGGIKKFLELNSKAPIYINRYAFGEHFNGSDKYIGLDITLADNERFVFVDGEHRIGENLWLFSCNDREKIYPADAFGLMVAENETKNPDRFLHEQYLLIEEGKKRVLISGCSHKGILNVSEWFDPDILVGGFHFKNLDTDKETDREKLTNASKILMSHHTKYFTCHCTGTEQYRYMKSIMGDSLEYISTGKEISI